MTLGKAKASFKELEVLAREAAALCNDRPLDTVRDNIDSEYPSPVTPSKLTGGRLLLTIPDDPAVLADGHLLTKVWLRRKQLLNAFWRRWRHDYLLGLAATKKWQQAARLPIELNQVVHIKDDHISRGKWRLGRIIQLHTSPKDGLVRSVTLKTSTGQINRPIHKLALLEGALLRDRQ